jgi:hypothetical protein
MLPHNRFNKDCTFVPPTLSSDKTHISQTYSRLNGSAAHRATPPSKKRGGGVRSAHACAAPPSHPTSDGGKAAWPKGPTLLLLSSHPTLKWEEGCGRGTLACATYRATQYQ